MFRNFQHEDEDNGGSIRARIKASALAFAVCGFVFTGAPAAEAADDKPVARRLTPPRARTRPRSESSRRSIQRLQQPWPKRGASRSPKRPSSSHKSAPSPTSGIGSHHRWTAARAATT